MKNVVVLASAVSLLALNTALACEADFMMKTDNGIGQKVVGRSDKINAYAGPEEGDPVFKLDLLLPYFVICEHSEFFRITNVQADTVEQALAGETGYVLKSQVARWNTREALNFTPDFTTDPERAEIVAWSDRKRLGEFMKTGNIKVHGPEFRENRDDTLKRERALRPYPVLGSEEAKVGRRKREVYNILLPAELKSDARAVIKVDDVEKAKAVFTDATIVLVFDATGSMAPFAREAASAILAAVENLEGEVRSNTRVGFVFFRDSNDAEKLVAFDPMPIEEAGAALKKYATPEFMKGGGSDPEPILDATYYAATQYDWGQSGKRILVGVLNVDAKPLTIGGLDEGKTVREGLDANAVRSVLTENSIDMITVQAGPKTGPNLVSVLTTLTGSRGQFIEWKTDGSSEREIARAFASSLNDGATEAIEEGTGVAKRIEVISSGRTLIRSTTGPASKSASIGDDVIPLKGYATIPLEVLNGELMERLRRNGIALNIDAGKSGVLVTDGYMMENDGLLTPVVQIEKDTLQNLISLCAQLGALGVDEESLREAAANALSALVGEDFDPTEPISTIIEKKIGIKFPSELLTFNLEYLGSLTPGERRSFQKRLQEAADNMGFYLEANLGAFDDNPAVYMPIAELP